MRWRCPLSDVASLLEQSMSAHMDALGGRRRKDARGAVAATNRAYETRYAAHQLDPDHLDAAWAAEQIKTPSSKDTHTAMMAFYEQQRARKR